MSFIRFYQSCTLLGPISLVADMYGLSSTFSPGTASYVGRGQTVASITGNGTLSYIAHVLVKNPPPSTLSTTASAYTILTIRVDPTQIIVSQADGLIQHPTIIIKNYNASLSSLANSADQFGQNNNPTLTNSTGTVIVPSAQLPPFSALPQSQYYTSNGVLVM
jgi:hypothetical protein